MSAVAVGVDVEQGRLAGFATPLGRASDCIPNGEDVLAFVDTPAITGSWDALTATLTLSGTDTLANYQAALRTVTYENTSDNPSNLLRTISFTVNDGDANSNTQTRDITVTPLNDPASMLASNSRMPANRWIESGLGPFASLTAG